MAKRPKPPEESAPAGCPDWMLTYADSMSLLLTFFVLLLTFSTKNKEDFQKAAGSLNGAMGGLAEGALDCLPSIVPDRMADPGRRAPYGPEGPPELGSMPNTTLRTRVQLSERLRGTPVTLPVAQKGFLIRIPADDVFDSTKVGLSQEGREIINKIGSVVRLINNDIEVAVHTDATTPDGPGSKADIDLSIAQGKAIMRQLLDAQYSSDRTFRVTPARLALSAPGGGTPLREGWWRAAASRNRRVVITLLKFAH